ncbi:hypothetical protein BDP67DRAFT_563331 [Colletotrichum lupini]|nr:hypothetical protein BDP67DRAFT_563331 [Colletotrichum lupini]
MRKQVCVQAALLRCVHLPGMAAAILRNFLIFQFSGTGDIGDVGLDTKKGKLTGNFVGDSAPGPRPDFVDEAGVDALLLTLRPLLRLNSPPKRSRLENLRSRSASPVPIPKPPAGASLPFSCGGESGGRASCCCRGWRFEGDNGRWSCALDPRLRSDNDGIFAAAASATDTSRGLC